MLFALLAFEALVVAPQIAMFFQVALVVLMALTV